MQAKRVQRTAFDASDTDGYVDIDSKQLRQLSQAARVAAEQIPGLEAWLATYARVDATPPCHEMELQRCELHHHDSSCTNERPSLWIGNSEEIANANLKRVPVREIIEHSVRLDCILPCIEAAELRTQDGPARKGFILQGGLLTFQQCVAIIQGDADLSSGFVGALRIY